MADSSFQSPARISSGCVKLPHNDPLKGLRINLLKSLQAGSPLPPLSSDSGLSLSGPFRASPQGEESGPAFRAPVEGSGARTTRPGVALR